MPADVTITEYTDPACPWAYSAEPFRWRLEWLYGDQVDWRVVMVGLSDGTGPVPSFFTPEWLSENYKKISHQHKMPIDTRVRERLSASVPACRAVVAARLNAPEQMRALLRALRVRTFAGELLDDPATIDAAARDAGLDPDELGRWIDDEATQAALDEDMAAARQPSDAARVLDHKLGAWPGGRRYTCPSYEIERATDGGAISAPGFQPLLAYEVALANLAPGATRRADPESVEEVLDWAGTPLATIEVATIMNIDFDDARERLARAAVERPVGFDGFWSLA